MKKHLISTILISAMTFNISVFADKTEVIRDIDSESFTISGTAEPATVVRTLVVAPGKTYSDADDAENPFDVVKYQNETDASEDGSYAFLIELSGESGVYTAYVVTSTTSEEVKLEYINPENYSEIIAGLNESSDIESYIEENRDDLGFFLELYDSADKAKVCAMIEEKMPLDEDDIQNAVSVFNSACLATAISEKEIEGVSDYSDKIRMLNDESNAAKWYKTVDAKEVDKRLDGDYDTVKEFEDDLREAIVLCVVDDPNGYANVKAVISDFCDEIGISSPSSKDSVYKELAGESYKSYSDLKDAYDAALKSSKSNNSGGSSGGGSSSSSSRNNVTLGIETPSLVEKEPMTPIVKKYFSDMAEASWAEEAVEYLAGKEILTGKSENIFAPMDKITREEFVTIIVRAFGFEKYADTPEFDDISSSDWCYEYVLAAKQNGIIDGVGEKQFGKGQNITRQDMATILYRVIKKMDIKLSTTEDISFKDYENIADYAKEAVMYLAGGSIINGMEDSTFRGYDNATRAQAAQMIYKVIKGLEG